MRILSFIAVFLIIFSQVISGQSPHEKTLKYDCSYCHESTDWKVIPQKTKFTHSETDFPLLGQHISVDCRSCHTELKFSGTQQQCSHCHKDIHMNTVGFDCSRCHSPQNWQVRDIKGLHQKSRFPLTGVHIRTDCSQCHSGFSNLAFHVEGVRCYDCHKQDYLNTSNPNHLAAGFSTECQDCHSINNEQWSAVNFAHDFFPLTGGHKIANCFSCHRQGVFTGLSAECYSCHQTDFEQSRNPNHVSEGFSTDCRQCHNINAFVPSTFQHSQTAFPLTGRHIEVNCRSCHIAGYTNTPKDCYSCHKEDYEGVKDPDHVLAGFPLDCSQCHNTSGWDDADFDHSITQFPLTGSHINVNCSSCHQSGFTGTSKECFACHETDYNSAINHAEQNYPQNCTMCHNTTIWSQTNFDHNNTAFPLTGVHITTNCSSCHISGFTGTPSQCVSCHQNDFNNSANPNHTTLGIPVTCQDCHTTNPEWQPALFPIHNNYYVIAGAHIPIFNNCSSCHNGNYNSTPNSCFGCHSDDYNATANPPHAAAGFSTECTTCHSQNAWTPSTFNHDGQYFPIYSGRHEGEWTACSDCHTNSANFSVFSCIDCHEHNRADMDDEHEGVSGYVYASPQCYACHPTGEESGAFNHSLSNFPLTGAHISVNCTQCHQTGYSGTTMVCFDCHQSHFSGTTNPDHQTLGISTECSTCHTTNPDWQPALFPQHDQFFVFAGTHLQIAQNCASCHSGNYNNTANQCSGCHQNDYNNAQNPNHQSAGISAECSSCHNSTAWIPSTFNHASTGFQLSGQHLQIQCSSCHQGSTGGLNDACITCHQADYNAAPNHTAQNYPEDCGMCHNSTAWNQTTFNHANTSFPLTGAHINTQCQGCHTGGFAGTTTICVNCHQSDYNNSSNPSHTALQLSSNCSNCHTTNPDWQPATFSVHNNYYPLLGAHSAIQNNCMTCHNGNYNTTPSTCYGCHQSDYNSTTNPSHQGAGFPQECQSCHTQNAWTPSTFDHDNLYFPIYSGRHQGEWDLCSDCHTNSSNFSVFSCINCHEHNQSDMAEEHEGVSGYVWVSTACLSCHPDGEDKKLLRPGVDIR
jgi:hypothetical protein